MLHVEHETVNWRPEESPTTAPQASAVHNADGHNFVISVNLISINLSIGFFQFARFIRLQVLKRIPVDVTGDFVWRIEVNSLQCRAILCDLYLRRNDS